MTAGGPAFDFPGAAALRFLKGAGIDFAPWLSPIPRLPQNFIYPPRANPFPSFNFQLLTVNLQFLLAKLSTIW
jgi:hypothetical protein